MASDQTWLGDVCILEEWRSICTWSRQWTPRCAVLPMMASASMTSFASSTCDTPFADHTQVSLRQWRSSCEFFPLVFMPVRAVRGP
jgi:hypothetical protein